MKKKPRLLLVSGGSLVGSNILDTLAGRRGEVEVFATNSVASGCFLDEFDGVYLTPPTLPDMATFEARLIDVIDALDPDLVIPCRDDDVVCLSELRQKRPEIADRILCGAPEVGRATFDKYLSWRFSVDNGLPFAPTLATTASTQETLEFAGEYGFPLLVKPLHGYAARDVWLVLNEPQLLKAAGRPGFIIQRFLGRGDSVSAAQRSFIDDGLPLFHSFEALKHSIQIMIGPGGECAGVFCSVNTNRYGTSLRLERHDGPDALELGRRCAGVFAAAGWHGPVNIQCQLTPEGALCIYEFNARFSGATAARCRMGYDEVGLAIELYAGARITPPSAPSGADHVIRIALDRVENDSVNNALVRDGVWRKGLQ